MKNTKKFIYTAVVATAFVSFSGLALAEEAQPAPAPQQDQNMQSQPAGSSVNIENGSFSPKTLTVPVGTTVTWKNNTNKQHTVTSDTNLFDSGPVAENATFSYTFDKAGQYPYYCKTDGAPGGVGMAGMVVVSDSEAMPPDQSQNPGNQDENYAPDTSGPDMMGDNLGGMYGDDMYYDGGQYGDMGY